MLYYNELSLLVVDCLLKGCRLVELCEDVEAMANGCLSLVPRVYNGLGELRSAKFLTIAIVI